ncbi:peptidoglycan-recognition protein SC2-like [Schistocerca gregaria]|uniref:peptidoglycan-recognition protein SC2-like n=1 Tax=Schistocerca gregaria TaxID=7010 RepID=UPI00211E302A|nr:peptidoglycan-recognition protein SC2-like [Schistocerca gregaria]
MDDTWKLIIIMHLLAAVSGAPVDEHHLEAAPEPTSPPGEAGCPRIVSRAEWGARQPTAPPDNMTASAVPYVVVHHGGAGRGYCFDQKACAAIVRSYQDLHMDTNGWDDIGYSFVVGEDGNAYEGRGWDAKGAHAPGYNQQSIGICIIGEFSERLPNDAALQALQQLMWCGVSLGELRPGFEVLGHRQARNTTCPGDALYGWLQRLGSWTADPQPCVDGECPAAASRGSP